METPRTERQDPNGPNSLAADPQLRIALFTGNYNYIKDGVALTLNRLVHFLEQRGVAVLVFAPTAPKPAFEADGELVSVPSMALPFRSEYRMALGLPAVARQRLAEFRPNLFHIAVPDLLGYRALKLAGAQNIPVVASFHTRYDTYLKFYGLGFLAPLGLKYFRYFYRKCRMVYPPSESMAAIIREEDLTQNVHVWSRGVDAEFFNPARRSLEWRRSLGIADNEVVVTFAGRLVKEKNTDLTVRVLEKLKRQPLPFRAMIVGDGPEGARMKAALPDGVFTGFLHGEALSRAYASSDIFLFPSESETFGNVTLEAMASGLPTVCANASGSNSLVVDGSTGYLIDAKSEAVFVDRLAGLVGNHTLRTEMGHAARKRALTFDWDAILSDLLASYREVVALHGGVKTATSPAARVEAAKWTTST